MDPQPHQRGGPAPPVQQQVQGGAPVQQQVQGGAPVQQQVQGGGPLQQQVQGAGPLQQQVALTIPAEITFKAYEFLRFEPKYLKLPKRAPAVEGTRFLFHREKDKTGSTVGDLIKRKAYYRAEKLGDKRREVLWVLPANKQNEAYLKHLGNELTGLLESLDNAIAELDAVVPGQFARPRHFNQPPALKK